MQVNKKEILLNALAKTIKELRGKKSQYLLSAEYDIPQSVISNIEKGTKDPQLTTIFKISEAFNMSPDEFMLKLRENLPKDFKFIDD